MNSETQYYPLTHPQKIIWHMEKFFPCTSLAVIAGTITLQENVDCSILNRAINYIIENNEGLRLRLVEYEGQPRQYVADYSPYDIEVLDFRNKDKKEFYLWEEEQARTPFSLIDHDLFYFAIVKVNECDTAVLIKTHHLVSDGWTMTLIASQVIENYLILSGRILHIIQPKPSYLDYIFSEEEYKKSDKMQKAREYWLNKYEMGYEVAKLKSRTSNDISTRSCRKTFILPEKLYKKILEYTKANGISVFSLYACAVSMYISRVTGKESFNFGTFILNRSNKREKEIMGMFANTVPLMVKINSNENLKEFAKQIAGEFLSVLKNQKYPHDMLKCDLRQKLSTEESLIDIILSYQNAKLSNESKEMKYKSRWHFNENQTHSLTIDINDRENEGKLIISYDYLEEIFYAKEIDFIHDHIVRLLWHALDNPEKPICHLDMLSETEKRKVLFDFNNTACYYPKEMTLDRVFEEQAHRTPDNVAVISDNETLTYRQLNDKAEKLAYILRQQGVNCDDIVGIMMHRSLDMMVSILAVLKAGAAYMPIDPDYPHDRIAYMLDDSKAAVLLVCQRKISIRYIGRIITVDHRELDETEWVSVEKVHNSRNLAYVIYTSGSTGKPKGVMIEHYSVINRIYWMQRKYPLTDDDIILQKTTYTFDVSVWELVWWFFAGARMCFLEPGDQKFPDRIIAAVERYKVTVMHFVPSMLQAFLEYLEVSHDETRLHTLKRVFASGEALTLNQVHKFDHLLNKSNGTKLTNLYGPTEATVDVSYYDCLTGDKCKSVPIGKPIDNTQLYILDSYHNLLPIGVAGELYIAGDGLARGYINKPELTKERFVNNPFKPGEKMYKTGDLARWMSQGDIEYLGRIDHQIKIRGFRIEVGEIETQIESYPNIKQAVVIAKNDERSSLTHLCAYFTAGELVEIGKLKNFLSTQLPEYMVPGNFMQVPQIPLSANGKVDRNALSVIMMNEDEYRLVPAVTQEQEILAEAFKKELNLKEIGINQNFFELGADSLKVINVLVTVFKYGWGIEMQDFYRYPTIELLCRKITSQYLQMMETAAVSDTPETCIRSVYKNRGGRRKKSDGAILLTGATGFLGSHILHQLAITTDRKIYCLVRKTNCKRIDTKFSQFMHYYFDDDLLHHLGNRIILVEGDITIPNFGLTAANYKQLTEEVSVIVHCAALVKHYGMYEEFEKVNVAGTKVVVDFAADSGANFYHISTLSVSGEYLVSIDSKKKVFSEKDFEIGQNLEENVYVKSKFEAEKIVKKACKNGVAASILRIGNLTARFSDGKKQIDVHTNSFEKHLSVLFELGMVSDNILDIDVEFTPVDSCASCIVKLIEKNVMKDVLHLINKRYVKLNRIVDLFNKKSSLIQILSLEDFLEKVKKRENSSQYLFYLMGEKNFSIMDGFRSNIEIDARYSLQVLKKYGIEWPEINDKYILEFFNGWIKDDENQLSKA